MARYRRSLPSTKALTAKIVALTVAGALVIGVVISVEMAGGNDPALGQKATAAKKSSAATPAGSGSSSSAGSGTGPYTQQYGYGYSNPYGSGSSGSGSASSGYSYSPPVTSSTS